MHCTALHSEIERHTKTLLAKVGKRSDELTTKELLKIFADKAFPKDSLSPVTSIVTGQDPVPLHDLSGRSL